MAEIEEGEHGDQGRVRAWLARALGAPRDPAWIADGRVFAEWAPVSPVSGRVDAFEWKVPPARLPAERQMEIEAWAMASEPPPAVEAKAVTAAPAAEPPPPAKPAEAGPEAAKPAEEPDDAKPAEAKPGAAKVVHADLEPRAPDDPGPPRREDEDERYHIF